MKVSIAVDSNSSVGYQAGGKCCYEFIGCFIPEERNVVFCSAFANETNVHCWRSSLVVRQYNQRIFNYGANSVNGCGLTCYS